MICYRPGDSPSETRGGGCDGAKGLDRGSETTLPRENTFEGKRGNVRWERRYSFIYGCMEIRLQVE